MPSPEAFDIVAYAELIVPRLAAAAAELARYSGLEEEKAWLETARARLTAVHTDVGDLLIRALRVPEIAPLKGEHARVLQGAAVDAVEHVQAAVAFAGGPRSPLLEALFFKLKVPALRKCDKTEFEQFTHDFEKRLASSYARRMLADPDYAAVTPALERLRGAVATWRGVFVLGPLSEEDAQPIRDELEAAAQRLELPTKQARLLAQAALAPLKELGEPLTAGLRPRKKGEDDGHPALERDPPDPSEPTEAERDELRRVHAAARGA